MGRYDPIYTKAPWGWLLPSDVREASGGEPELRRDLRIDGRSERHFGLHVWGQAEPCPPSLGIIALRCERHGSTLIPLTLSIPETPMVIEHRAAPVLATQSNPRRMTDLGVYPEGDGA